MRTCLPLQLACQVLQEEPYRKCDSDGLRPLRSAASCFFMLQLQRSSRSPAEYAPFTRNMHTIWPSFRTLGRKKPRHTKGKAASRLHRALLARTSPRHNASRRLGASGHRCFSQSLRRSASLSASLVDLSLGCVELRQRPLESLQSRPCTNAFRDRKQTPRPHPPAPKRHEAPPTKPKLSQQILSHLEDSSQRNKPKPVAELERFGEVSRLVATCPQHRIRIFTHAGMLHVLDHGERSAPYEYHYSVRPRLLLQCKALLTRQLQGSLIET